MISISPITYPNLIEKQVQFVSLDLSSKRILTIKGKFRTYNGKRLNVVIDNQLAIEGIYNCDSAGVQTITFTNTVSVSAASKIKIFETFEITDDNQSVTFQDIYEKLNPIAAENIDDSLISNQGKAGLISGFDKLKLDSVLYDFKRKDKVIITNDSVRVCNLKLNQSTINHFRIFLYSTSVNGLFDALLTVAPNCEYYSIRVISHLSGDNIKLNLSKLVYDDGSVYVGIDFGFENNSRHEFQLYIGATGLESFLLPKTAVAQTVKLKLNGSEDSVICDKTLVSIDVNNEKRITYDNETILRSKVIDGIKCYDLKAGYHLVEENKKPIDVPANISFSVGTVIVFNDNKTLLFIDDKRQMFIGIKNDTNKNVDWTEIGYKEHKHSGSDINQDASHRFVTDEEKLKWNKTTAGLDSSVWKDQVADETKLPTNTILNTIITVAKHTQYGNNPVVLQHVAENVWVPLNAKIFQTDITDSNNLYPGMSGSLVSPTLMSQIKAGGIGKSLTIAVEKEQFIHVLTEARFYSGNNKFFDINKRTNNVSIGNYVVSFGFENTNSISEGSVLIGSKLEHVTVANSVLIGSGLQGNGVHFGSYNINNGALTIGNGTGNDSRSNLFWITDIGQVTTKQSGSYKIDGVPQTEILVSGGHISQDSFVSKSEFERTKDEFVSREYFTYFKHEAKDKNIQVPVIVNISAPSNISYYKKIIDKNI